MMGLKSLPVRLIGFVVLAYVLYLVDLDAVWKQVREIGAASVVAAGAAFLVLLSARCVRWHLLVQCLAPRIPFAKNFLSCNESVWFGMATPGRVGEFGRGLDLARSGETGLLESSGLVVFDLLIDLFAYASLAAGGIALLALRDVAPFGAIVYAGCALAAVGCLIGLPTLSVLLRRWVPRLSRIRGAAILTALQPELERRSSWGIAATTVLASLAYTLMIAALAAPMNLGLDFIDLLTMVGLVGVSGAIPVTYFGFGTREVVLIWYFAHLGLDKETAVAVSFSFLVAQLIGIAVSLALSLSSRFAQRLGASR